MTPEAVATLADVLVREPRCAAVGPRIVESTGETQVSVRRAPRLAAAFAEALFVHRLFPDAPWATDMVRDGYDVAHDAEWLIGAAVLVRRSAFEELGGFEERFFMYSEDADLGTRLRARGYVLRYEPAAVAHHEGRASAPGPTQAPVRASARVGYVRLHEHGVRYFAFRLAYALDELLRLPLALARSRRHFSSRLRAFRVSVAPRVERWVPE